MAIKRRVRIPTYRKNKFVSLERWEETGLDSRGQTAGDWTQFDQVWAHVRPLTTRTAEFAHNLYAEATDRLLIDWRSDVRVGDRVTFEGRKLYIGHAANLDEENVTLELLCSEERP